MISQIPGAKNWPDSRAGKKLAAKRARLIPIASGNELDPEGKLLQLMRRFQKDDPGRLEGFVGAFLYRDKQGNRRVVNSAHGRIGLEMQMMLGHKLVRWLESDE